MIFADGFVLSVVLAKAMHFCLFWSSGLLKQIMNDISLYFYCLLTIDDELFTFLDD